MRPPLAALLTSRAIVANALTQATIANSATSTPASEAVPLGGPKALNDPSPATSPRETGGCTRGPQPYREASPCS